MCGIPQECAVELAAFGMATLLIAVLVLYVERQIKKIKREDAERKALADKYHYCKAFDIIAEQERKKKL